MITDRYNSIAAKYDLLLAQDPPSPPIDINAGVEGDVNPGFDKSIADRMIAGLYQMQQNAEFTDAVIQSSDSKRISVHRNILAVNGCLADY